MGKTKGGKKNKERMSRKEKRRPIVVLPKPIG
jgi:hypothetical protein